MSIRLSKACNNLNVGLSTIVDYLTKVGHPIKNDPNTKITDDEYLLLANEFNKDVAKQIEADKKAKELQEKELATQKNSNVEQEKVDNNSEKIETEKKTSISESHKPQLKPVGHIDLDKKVVQEKKTSTEAIKKEETVAKKTKVETAVTPIAEPIKEESPKIENTPKTEETPKVEKRSKIENTPKIEETPKTKSPQKEEKKEIEKKESVKSIIVEKKEKEKKEIELEQKPKSKSPKTEPKKKEEEPKKEEPEDEIFKIKTPEVTNTPVVLGTIDLSKMNQATRPEKKSKADKRKEREERKSLKEKEFKGTKSKLTLSKVGDKDNDDNETKNSKRKRIKSFKVDIKEHSKSTNNADNKKRVNTKVSKTKVKPLKTEVSEEDVNKQIKETLEKLRNKGRSKSKRARRTIDKSVVSEVDSETREIKSIQLTEFVTASELATMMDVSINDIIKTCLDIGMMVSINQRLDAETINIVAEEFGFETQYVSHDVIEALSTNQEPDKEEDLEPRAPVVTIMGHVDHGKTSLLDYIRKTNVIAGEAGGITQHIGAYNVKLKNGQKITFLDTPGHEAFTAMRARGAEVTDLAIIIIAADDNIKPQTREAISHATAAGVPIVFAINKVDVPAADPEKVKGALSQMNYLVEDWGGKYQSQDISAKFGKGVDELLEKILLEAEMLDLKANPNRNAIGSVIESSLDKGRGYVSKLLVQNGTLKQGDVVLAGIYHGKVKAMFNEREQRIESAKPSEPVLILGLNGAPQAGDNFYVVESEQEARDIANKREHLKREQDIRTKKHFTLDELGRRIALGDFQELNIIVKGDVDGSVEALSDSLQQLSRENIQVNIVHKAVGAITDTDVMLAAASNAIIVGFEVRPTASAKKMAEKEEIDIRNYSIIYDAIDEIKSAMEGMLSPKIKEVFTANLEVLSTFKITKVGTIAGCVVREGKIKRDNKVRVIRDGIVIHTGELDSLKHYKDDVKEVSFNSECGLGIKNYQNIQAGDTIESFEEIEVKQKL